jgi:thermitase
MQKTHHLPLHAIGIAVTALVLGTTLQTATAQTGPDPAEWAPGRLLVMPRAGLPAAELAKLLKPHGGIARRLGGSDLHLVQLPANMSEVAVQRLLARHPLLKFAELDHKVRPAVAANDPYVGSAWHLPVVKADAAWGHSTGAGVTIAVLDSGVLATHADLLPNLVAGWNSRDNNAVTGDVTGHGTSVAGVAAAALNNGVGVAGIAGRARLMPVRITDSAGTAYYSSIASGVIWAADNGARVVNCSYGYLFKNASVQSAGNYLKGKGGLLVVSAGNNGIDENSAATSAMLVVSATDSADNRAGWSSYGQMVSVAAPGTGIWTTTWNGGYGAANGTSYASPLVAGVVALMMSANPALAPAQVESLLFSTALDLGAAGKDIHYGHGRVDAEAAVQAALAASAIDSQAPAVALASPAGGSTVSGLVAVDVNATDNVGVARVELRLGSTVVATDTVAPYQFSWDSRTVPNGSVSLSARAFDAAGNAATSASLAVTVANAVAADTTPPLVAITAPADGQAVPAGNVNVAATASDDAGSAGLRQELAINGKLVASATGGSLSYRWNTRKLAAGWHTLAVTASDAAGNRTTKTIQVRR